jgi:vacuolar protein-sorting-associated protein 4
MDNSKFLTKATEFINQAVLFDRTGEYEKALEHYQKALEYFITGLKYEQNPTSKRIIQEKVAGYMDRAEQIKKAMADGQGPTGGGSNTKTLSKEDKNKEKEDDEKSKMRGALSSAIVSEKPNVRWDDVAGLEGAKEALKEGN